MANPNQNPEAAPKKSSVTDSVESLIQRKKMEKDVAVSGGVSAKMGETKEEVADVMGGAEGLKEKVSERKGETGEKGDISGAAAATGDDQAQVVAAQLQDYQFPSEAIMVKKIRTAIQAQIKLEWKKANLFRGQLDRGGADGYNKSISRIRALKQALASLFMATVGFLKNVYVKYFTSDGKRKKLDEV